MAKRVLHRWGFLLAAVLVGVGVCCTQAQKPPAVQQQASPGKAASPEVTHPSDTHLSDDHPSGAHPSEGCTLLPYAGTTPLSDVQYYSAGEEDLRGGMTCTFVIDPKRAVFTFRFPGKADNKFGNLEITDDTHKLIQTIENETEAGLIAPEKAQNVLIAVDANFDGYKDLQILNNCGATGNCASDFYVYDPAGHRFVHNDFLTKLTTPEFDPAKKQVVSSSNSSANDWQRETYQFENGRYTLIRQELSEWDRDKQVVNLSTFELRNGKMTLVDSSTKQE